MAGRRSKLDRCKPKLIEALAAGATVSKACKVAGCSEEVFYKWQRENEQFLQAITRAREGFAVNIDADLINAWTQRLLTLTTEGHTVTRTTAKYVRGPEGDMVEVARETETIHYSAPPKWVADKLMPDSLALRAGPLVAVQVNQGAAA